MNVLFRVVWGCFDLYFIESQSLIIVGPIV